jgi:hypothetical protein
LKSKLGRKMLLVVTVLAVLASTMPGVAGAASKKDSTKGKDAGALGVSAGPGSAKGKGTQSIEKFKFSAKSTKGADAMTPSAKGKYSITQGSAFAKGKVQCLEVDSVGGANFAGAVKKTNVLSPGFSGEFEALDSGQPKGQGDLLAIDFTPSAPTCSTPTDTGAPIASGNIVVHAKP